MKSEIIRVLLADDEQEDRKDFIEAFKSLKINTAVETVKSGDELIKYLTQKTFLQLPHLLFLDLNMPKKTGLECLLEIRKIDKLKNLIVVIYSASSHETDVEETFLGGANVYIKKPAHLTVLKKTLLHILTISWQYHTSNLNRNNFLLHL